MADTENLNEIDPIQELEQAKIEIKKKISAQKTTIQYEKKELTRLRNLPLEFNPNKPTLVKDQEEKINLMNGNLTELEHDLKNLDKTRDDENEEKIQAALHQLKTKWLDVMTNSSYIIQDEEYIHIDDYSTDRRDQNVQIRKYKPKQFSEFLSKTLKVPSWHLPEIRVKTYTTRITERLRWLGILLAITNGKKIMFICPYRIWKIILSTTLI